MVTGRRHRYFTAPPLDRAAELRAEAGRVSALFRAASTRVLALADGRIGLRRGGGPSELGWLGPHAVEGCAPPVFLGLEGCEARFAITVTPAEQAQLEMREGLEFRSLRHVAGTLDGASAGIGAYALAMHQWQGAHRFCGACGSPTITDHAGFRLTCGGCGRTHFPRLDPAIIVSVRDGERCLLGRQPSWPAGRYSVLAGFVEPGEALEDAVAREVLEEAGVTVEQVAYRGSQPWPFPASLMLGFTARAKAPTLRRGDELEDIAWFEPAELLGALAEGRVHLPPPLSISRFLIDEWLIDTTGRDPAAWEPGGAAP